jgi:hypothetical protein
VRARLRRLWLAWVALWEGTEHPRTLAIVRVLLGCVMTWDFLEIRRLDLVVALFGSQKIGGLSDAATRHDPPLFYDLFPPTEASATGLHAALVLACLAFTAGFFTRTSALVLLGLWAQFAQIMPASDRGIDTLCRDVLTLFLFARAGDWLSVDAVARTGSPFGDGRPVPAWPRKLLILQIVAMYFLAGIQKTGVHWWPMGHFAALYFILLDPAIGRFDFAWLRGQPWFFLTQVGTVTTIVLQDTYPAVLLLRWARATAHRGGRWRLFLARWSGLEVVWIGFGAMFHVLLAATTELGIFPYAMLALYPAWVHPDAWPRMVDRLRGRAVSA